MFVLIEALDLLVTSLSGLLCGMDRCVSFTISFNVFVVQSFAFLLCFNKIRSLIDWSLNTLSIQRNVPGILLSTSFFKRRHVGVSFQCKCVILFDLFFSPPNIGQRLAVLFIPISSFKEWLYNYHLGVCGLS